jgi:hypothetical protein
MKKTFILSLLLIISVILTPAFNAVNVEAGGLVKGINWGKVVVSDGVIGKVIILKDMPLLHMDKTGKLISNKKVKKGSEFIVTKFDSKISLYTLGGGFYLKSSKDIKYLKVPQEIKAGLESKQPTFYNIRNAIEIDSKGKIKLYGIAVGDSIEKAKKVLGKHTNFESDIDMGNAYIWSYYKETEPYSPLKGKYGIEIIVVEYNGKVDYIYFNHQFGFDSEFYQYNLQHFRGNVYKTRPEFLENQNMLSHYSFETKFGSLSVISQPLQGITGSLIYKIFPLNAEGSESSKDFSIKSTVKEYINSFKGYY